MAVQAELQADQPVQVDSVVAAAVTGIIGPVVAAAAVIPAAAAVLIMVSAAVAVLTMPARTRPILPVRKQAMDR